MARKIRRSHRSESSGGFFGNALNVLGGTVIAVAYEVFVSPMIPLGGMIKNVIEFVLGLFIASMKKLPKMVRAGGVAIATVNAYAIVSSFMTGSGSGSANWE